MKANDKTQAQVGALVGVSQAKVSDWLLGRRISLANAIAVRDATGVPAEAWLESTIAAKRLAKAS